MKNGFAIGGKRRLRKGIEAKVKQEFEAQLKAAKGWRERMAIRKQTREKVRAELRRLISPQALWGA